MKAPNNSARFSGRIISAPDQKGFAFIGIATVIRANGSPHGLDTTQDIFVHRDDSAAVLEPGKDVTFDVTPDTHRGGKTFRAVAVREIAAALELIPANESAIPGFTITVPPVRSMGEIAHVPRTLAQSGMKQVPAGTVQQVVANAPLPRISRENDIPTGDEERQAALRRLLIMLFPTLGLFGTDFKILDHTDAEFDAQVAAAITDYEAMGLTEQIGKLRAEVKKFREVREILKLLYAENLVRRDTIIPIEYLPDLFMAVPVWYHWMKSDGVIQTEIDWQERDPEVRPQTRFFCKLFPNQRWTDTFLMFNRRLRSLKQYSGDMIPPHVAKRMRGAVELFDHVVIATPYHDVAGKDWDDVKWLRSIDPYILGFKEGIPFFFVLARFSDSGTFPLFNELLADTIEFLTTNKEKLKGFGRVSSPYWINVRHPESNTLDVADMGDHLMAHTEKLLAAFKAGNLFDWLRGAEVAKAIVPSE